MNNMYKKQNRLRAIHCLVSLILLAFILMPETGNAQSVFPVKASPDNVFIAPNSSDPAFWDVLRNDTPGDCSFEDLQVTIVTPPSRPHIYCDVLSNYIYYIPDGSYWGGRDSLVYEINCKGTTSQAKVYIHVNNQPENILTDLCHVTIPAIDWQIKQLAISDELVSIATTPLAGDLDGDGSVEIIVMNPKNSGSNSSELLIFGFNDALANPLFVKDRITIPTTSCCGNTYVIANVDENKYTSIFLTTNNTYISGIDARQLIKYTFNGTSWNESWRRTYSSDDSWAGCVPIVADFMGAGNVQVAVYDKIYNAQDGTLLVDGGFLSTAGHNFGRLPHSGSAGTHSTNVRFASWAAADIDNDGKLEIIAGNCAYKVNISNPNGVDIGNTYTRFQIAAAAGDGAIAIADIDMDGLLDVVVTWRDNIPNVGANDGRMTVYNPRSGALMSSIIAAIPIHNASGLLGAGPSSAFIGDITGDGSPNIVFTGNAMMDAYSYDPTLLIANRLTRIWRVVTSDTSASTVMSLFDFNQDGISELIYRDETHLRIINGSLRSHITGNDTIIAYDLASFANVRSTTISEYPIVADINGDGAAEIIVTGHTSAHGWTGFLRVFASDAEPWAPARSVWDKYFYNPVYVNDNLTIPSYPINPAIPLYESDGVKTNRPFNNFLQQATMLNDEGRMLYLGPDIRIDPYKRPSMILNTGANQIEMNVRIGNIGDADFIPPLEISLYVYDTPTDTYTLIHSITRTADTIKIGKTADISYIISGYSSLPFPAFYDKWYVFLNASGSVVGAMPDFPFLKKDECAYWNNISTVSLCFGERVVCADTQETVTISPEGVDEYRWYDAGIGGNLVNTGDSYTATHITGTDKIKQYFIDVYTTGAGGTKISSTRDTINVYCVPDSLVWKGTSDADWHNFQNWTNPDIIPPATDPYPKANIPRKCTNVLIPDRLATYPNLMNSQGIATSYAEYSKSECANITFEHGGEVVRTDSLDYDAAYVHLNLLSNRWYMLSSPLQSLFPGDYYVNDPRPCEDDVFVYTRLFSRSNPETGKYAVADWTGTFNNPDYPLACGFGFSAWVDDKQPSLAIHDEFNFFFPKKDTQYTIYNPTSPCEPMHSVSIPRVNEHRFIYEPGRNPSTGDIPMVCEADSANRQFILGNPFMAHLDFERFYDRNSTRIKDYYQILDKTDGVFVTYTYGGASTGTPPLNKYISPMQSVLMESKTGFGLNTLVSNPYMVSNRPNEKLRSSTSTIEPSVLTIEVSRGEQMNKALLLYSPEYAESFEENMPKVFINQIHEPVSVYTSSLINGHYLDIQKINNLDEVVIPIGIRTSQPGKYRLNFAGLSGFAPGYEVWLNDLSSSEPVSYNLNAGSIHTFEKTTDEVFDNRFTLSFRRAATGIEIPVKTSSGINVYARQGVIHVNTTDNSLLNTVEVIDLQGRVILSQKRIGTQTVEIPVPAFPSWMYIVRVTSERTSRTVKVVL